VPKKATINPKKRSHVTNQRERIIDLLAQAANVEIDFTVDPRERPLTGIDLDQWRAVMGITSADVAYALAIPPSKLASRCRARAALSLDLEILIRLYEKAPGPPTWYPPSMREVYEALYKADQGQFAAAHGQRGPGYARQGYYARFAALFGRTLHNAYRWIDYGGNVRADMSRIAGKLWQLPVDERKLTLEHLSRRAWKMRGIDFDLEFPEPTPEGLEGLWTKLDRK
jgi:hypothetical protein